MRIDQLPDDAGERRLGRALFGVEDQDRIRPRRPQRRRKPADQEQELVVIHVDVLRQEVERTTGPRNGERRMPLGRRKVAQE